MCENVLKTYKCSANILLALVVYMSVSPASFLSFISIPNRAHIRHLTDVSDTFLKKVKITDLNTVKIEGFLSVYTCPSLCVFINVFQQMQKQLVFFVST